ncbi:GNAT family N-acetyltransferase [Bacillus salitolerans]|uniref:GNAT family N-acetyltransferase n=1 Tax=Bacillus salitolerans TaxID=1437434 RepID=A0ABW4LLT0_9BACI
MNNLNMIKLEEIEQENRYKYLHFLLLADESEEVVRTYMNEGDLFAIYFNQQIVGTVLFTHHQNKVVELKNIAITENDRNKGFGKVVIEQSCNLYKQNGFTSMIVGTANSSIGNLAFYQKAGFRMVHIKKDFFLKYESPIYENGIRALDMVMFEKNLS